MFLLVNNNEIYGENANTLLTRRALLTRREHSCEFIFRDSCVSAGKVKCNLGDDASHNLW